MCYRRFCDYFPGAVISGNNKIEDRVYFGSNSSSKQGIEITSDVTVGLNAGVVSDLAEAGVYVGTPAKNEISLLVISIKGLCCLHTFFTNVGLPYDL